MTPRGAEARPPGLSRKVTSFEPRTQGWLHEAINGPVGLEAVEDTDDYRKQSEEVARRCPGVEALTPIAISQSS